MMRPDDVRYSVEKVVAMFVVAALLLIVSGVLGWLALGSGIMEWKPTENGSSGNMKLRKRGCWIPQSTCDYDTYARISRDVLDTGREEIWNWGHASRRSDFNNSA
jgi:hypothetical protein